MSRRLTMVRLVEQNNEMAEPMFHFALHNAKQQPHTHDVIVEGDVLDPVEYLSEAEREALLQGMVERIDAALSPEIERRLEIRRDGSWLLDNGRFQLTYGRQQGFLTTLFSAMEPQDRYFKDTEYLVSIIRNQPLEVRLAQVFEPA